MLSALDTAKHLVHLPARQAQEESWPPSLPQSREVRGLWGLLSSPTEPRREQGKEAIPTTQLFKNKEWAWGYTSCGKLWFRSETWSRLQLLWERERANAFYIKGAQEAEPRESVVLPTGTERPLAPYQHSSSSLTFPQRTQAGSRTDQWTPAVRGPGINEPSAFEKPWSWEFLWGRLRAKGHKKS